jgi:hypothetical protein
MDKKELAVLIEAYAEAKASRNPFLVNVMVPKVEKALDEIFPEPPEQREF